MTHMQISMCDGKVPLTWAIAAGMSKRDKWREKKRGAYHCPICHAWHLGRKPKRGKAALGNRVNALEPQE